MKPAYCLSKLPREQKMEFWAENRRVVEGILDRYSVGKIKQGPF